MLLCLIVVHPATRDLKEAETYHFLVESASTSTYGHLLAADTATRAQEPAPGWNILRL